MRWSYGLYLFIGKEKIFQFTVGLFFLDSFTRDGRSGNVCEERCDKNEIDQLCASLSAGI